MRDGACRLLLFLCGLRVAYPAREPVKRAPEHDQGDGSADVTPHWEVFPELSRDGHRLSLEEVVQVLPSRLLLSLDLDGKVVQVELQHNQYLLPASHRLTYYLPDGGQVTEDKPGVMNCYYQGQVKGQEGPWSSLSLCSGISGVIVLSADRRFTIEPVPWDPSHKHIVRPAIDRLLKNKTCWTGGASHEQKGTTRSLLGLSETPNPRMKRDVLSEMKFVELVMIADNSEYKMFHEDLKRLHVRMLEIANKVDAFYRALNVRVALVGVEVWNQKDQILVSTDPAETLNRFLSWREKKLLPRVAHDNAQLLTGVTFKDSSVGMATMNSMCSPDRSGGVSTDHSVSILGVASTVAHEIGHNLGLSHDTVDRKCGEPEKGKKWIMEPSSGYMPGLEFSNCSLSDLASSLRQGGGMCLFNVPAPQSLFGDPRCGNLMVEDGEQCDCGLTQECTDPCCNATSCQLVAGAECSSDGICCEQCKLKPPGSVCREPLGECDLPEYCNGVSPHCPPNVFLQNGEPCEKGVANCYQGECRTLRTQCQNLWGPGSTPAPKSCFSKVNMRGDKYGNCGRGPNGTYLPCAEKDVWCGKIQCQGGSDRPKLGSSVQIVAVRVTVNGSEVSCRGTHFNLGDDIWDPALVMTGTVCGTGKVCVKQRCQDVATLKVQSCKSKCNGRGVCNSNNNCHCDPGWAPPDCRSYGQGGSTDSGPLALEKAGSALTTALLLIFLLFVPLVLLLGFCYIRREALKRRLGKFSKGTKCQYRVTQTSSQHRPQRPPPPPLWTQGTELQVMSANSKGSNRPEPPSKPLPPDPVHKRCQAAAQDRPPPPNRPLPADPLPRRSQLLQETAPGKPPPPKKPLPLYPIPQPQDPLLSVPVYPDHLNAAPSRPAPLPPYSGRTPRV
ncbi:disintegrin and metalloproteinase domain-containing protein 15 isoform 2-T2 [Rhinophrynus dorsalis]